MSMKPCSGMSTGMLFTSSYMFPLCLWRTFHGFMVQFLLFSAGQFLMCPIPKPHCHNHHIHLWHCNCPSQCHFLSLNLLPFCYVNELKLYFGRSPYFFW
jgi:hypothetical protein